MGARHGVRLLVLGSAIAVLASAGTAQAIDVTTIEDEFNNSPSNTGCSLREAVQSANSDTAHGGCTTGFAGYDQIYLDAGSTYELEIVGDDNTNESGDIDVKGITAIFGVEGARPTIDAAGIDRHFQIFNDPGNYSLDLNSLRLVNGLSDADGGAISAADDSIDLRDVELRNNSAVDSGGAISAGGSLDTSQTEFIDNESGEQNGGAIAIEGSPSIFDDLSVRTTSFVDNEAFGDGGAIHIFDDADVEKIENSTFVENSAARGGALSLLSTNFDDPLLKSLTVAGNTAEASGGGGGFELGTGVSIDLYGSVIAGNTSPDGPYNCDGAGTIDPNPNAYNLESSNTCGLSTMVGQNNIVGTDPQLAPLASYALAFPNYPPASMRAPFAGSPAVDAIPAGICPTSSDQRLVDRLFSEPCTIGAFEGSVPRPTGPATPSAVTPAAVAPTGPVAKKCKKGRKLKRGKCVKKKKKK